MGRFEDVQASCSGGSFFKPGRVVYIGRRGATYYVIEDVYSVAGIETP